jgi:two-component system sensor histidine kinase HydH
MSSNQKGTDGATDLGPSVANQIIDSLPSGVLAVNEGGMIVWSNPAACSHLQVSKEALAVGRPLKDLAIAAPFAEILREVEGSGAAVSRREIFVSYEDGSQTEIGLSAAPLEGVKAFNGVIFLFTDMTERRSLERTAELNRQLAELGELTAGVVHELRTPVTVISGMAELLIRRLGDSERDCATAQTIIDECGGLEKLISQFLGFTRPFEIDASRCAPEELLNRAYKLCTHKAIAKKVRLERENVDHLPPIFADGGRMIQVLVNLINNAVDAVDEGTGTVTLRAELDKGQVVFDVSDNGPGIHLSPGQDLFKPFFTMKEGGTGLGLSIVSRIVHGHGGTTTFRNVADGGASFRVSLPCADESGAG